MANSFAVKFWGVRGSIACPEASHLGYGGNTACVAVECGPHRIILDAGTGIRRLGQHLAREGVKDIHLLLSHLHLDHIIGLPFFEPAFDPATRITVRAGNLLPRYRLQEEIGQLMRAPFFPVSPQIFQAAIQYIDFISGEMFTLAPGLDITTAALNHPDGATGYRINWHGHSICYITDTEHFPDRVDNRIVELVRDTDLMVYDATFCPATYPRHQGWGHSTWQAAIAIAQQANVKRVALFHHDPDSDDAALTQREQEAQAAFPNLFAAREGMTVKIL